MSVESLDPIPKRRAGRPRDRLPDETVRRLGNPPEHPLRRQEWAAGYAAELLMLQATGQIGTELADSLRATLGLILRAVGTHTVARVARELKRDAEQTADDSPAGPEMVPSRAEPGIRHPAR